MAGRLGTPRWLFVAVLLLPGMGLAGEPRPLLVPPELAEVTSNPEISGITWSPLRRRYLLVTDDSGLRSKGTAHAPLLLGLSEAGVLDATPIAIRGIKALNDPESMCAGPGGTYFLVTSHSPNREDETPSPRRQLLQLKEGDGGLDVVARMDLTAIAGGRSLLAAAGAAPRGRLDVEALAYHDDMLFVGLKSPLTERGEAVILRLPRPLETMRGGHVRGAAIERLAAVPLCVAAKQRRVCQGISDMTFLPDGSMVLSANAPKGGPKDHGGALWHLPTPVGKASPVLLQRFPKLAPEGVTLDSNGRSLVVVFDCRDAAPRWTKIPLPVSRPHVNANSVGVP